LQTTTIGSCSVHLNESLLSLAFCGERFPNGALVVDGVRYHNPGRLGPGSPSILTVLTCPKSDFKDRATDVFGFFDESHHGLCDLLWGDLLDFSWSTICNISGCSVQMVVLVRPGTTSLIRMLCLGSRPPRQRMKLEMPGRD
jgi:hypothetical protein